MGPLRVGSSEGLLIQRPDSTVEVSPIALRGQDLACKGRTRLVCDRCRPRAGVERSRSSWASPVS